MSAPTTNLASSPLASDGLFRSALEASPDCVKILDLRGVVQFVNRNGVAIMGAYDAAELLGRSWPALWDEPQRAVATAAVKGAAQGAVERFAAPGRVFTGDVRHFDSVLSPLRDETGACVAILVASRDVTQLEAARLAAEARERMVADQAAHRELLLGELNHRVKNTLASVQSVVMQTLRDAPDVAEARDLLLDRLMALSATHNLLVKTAWESAAFRDLIDTTLSPYARPYAVTGPDLRLDPNFAISLGMALHELTMNALKHGAWKASGRVDIDVAARGPDIEIVWRESGGPVVAPPTRRGFGSRLLERGVAAELHGEVRLDFRPGGLVCTIRAPLSARLQVMGR